MVALFGDSQPILQLRQLMAACASSDASVLINGETGSGKEVVCRELHRLSRRSQRPFVAINCAAIPATLLESELFGYRKGAYTGATTDQRGRLEAAHGGTLFLDEIGDMPLDVQVKLLRSLEDRTVEPLGGAGDGVLLDVRVVAATHKDLCQLVEAGQFREDLFYRLNVVPLYIPPLRERTCELPMLINHFARLNARDTRPISLTEVSLALLSHYGWPGNIRELSNLIVRFSVLYPGQVIDLLQMPAVVLPPGLQATLLEHGERYGGSWEPSAPLAFPLTREEHLLDYFRDDAGQQKTSDDTLQSLLQGVMDIQALPADGIEAKSILERLEVAFIMVALRQTGNNNSHSARLLRMERTTFIQKLARHGINGTEDRSRQASKT